MKGARLFLLLLLSMTIIEPVVSINSTLNLKSNSKPSLSTCTQSSLQNSEKGINECVESTTSQIIPSCQNAVANNDVKRNWTVLVYMAADNDIEAAAYYDIKEMEAVGSTASVNIIVYVDFLTNNSPYHGSGAFTYNITKDTAPLNTTIWSPLLNTTLPKEPDMADPNTLLEFVRFGQSYAPALNYLLILWDHGLGYNGICFDETNSNDWLLPHEIALVLENDTIESIELIAFDASLMGQFELAYEIKDGIDYMIFSEDIVPIEGFPYQVFLNSLILIPNSSPVALAQEIVDRYIQAYLPGGVYFQNYPTSPSTLCLSVLNTSWIDSVSSWFNRTIDELLTPLTLPWYYSSICEARGLTQQFSIANFIDLASFTYQLSQHVLNLDVQSLTNNLTNAILSAVVYEQHLSGLPGATGLSINFDNYDPISLRLLNDTRYEEFIEAFQLIGETIETAINPLESGSLKGYLDGEGDSVYFRYTPTIAAQHTFELTVFQIHDEDFDLYLYDSSMNLLTRSIGPDSVETIQYALEPGQVYFVQALSYPREGIDYGLGSFRITIIPSSPTNPVTLVLLIAAIIGLVVIIFLIGFIIRRYWSRISYWWQMKRLTDQASPSTRSSEPPSSMVCVQCGVNLPEKAKFCPNCGKTFDNNSVT